MSKPYSASDVRRYARCPRQWWYETRRDELASLEPAELERRAALLRRRYGVRATELPAYQLLVDLAARQDRLASGRTTHREHATRVAQRRAGCLIPAALFVVALWLSTQRAAARYDT